jgi:hypothetical protein
MPVGTASSIRRDLAVAGLDVRNFLTSGLPVGRPNCLSEPARIGMSNLGAEVAGFDVRNFLTNGSATHRNPPE